MYPSQPRSCASFKAPAPGGGILPRIDDDEEQLTSYEAQKNYYADKIMTNKEWTIRLFHKLVIYASSNA